MDSVSAISQMLGSWGAGREQTASIAALRQQSEATQALVQVIADSAEAIKVSAPPPGQGLVVDRRA